MTGPRAEPRYRAARAGVLRIEPLDPVLTAVFHRGSGITHLLAEPAPQILAALAGDGLAAAVLLHRLGAAFDLGDRDGDGDGDALAARLDELVAAGLVEALPAGEAAA